MLRAMLLGSGNGLSHGAREELAAGGAAHILTVSGLHVSLIGGGAYLLAGRLLALIPWHRTRGRLYRQGFALCRGLLAGAAVLFYMEMSGAGLSVRRAGTMFLLLILARALGRSRDFPTALLLAAAAALYPSPYALRTSSFQLSFGTVCLLGTVIPFLFGKWRLRTRIGKSVTGAVLLAMGLLPLTLEHFYVWHPWQTAVNLLVLPLLPFVLGTGFLAALAAHLFLPAGRLFAAAAAGLLELIRGICRLSARLPFHALTLGKPALWQHLAWIGLCGVLLFLITGKAARRAESPEEALLAAGKRARFGAVREMIRFALAPGLLLTAGMLLFSLKTETELTITSLYVGQGDSHVIRTPGGGVYMIDGGRSLSGPGETVLVPFLRYSGSGHLKAVLVTHPDADHINGLAEVLSADGIRADVLGIPAVFRGDPELDELIAAAEEAGTSVLWLAQGDAWQDGDVSFMVLHPPEGESIPEDPNGASLVLLVRRGEFEGLLTGDIGEDTEAGLLAEGLLEETDWLKAPHHGSRHSDSEAFLSALRPVAATISCGRNNL
jgi:competence protein ComEC